MIWEPFVLALVLGVIVSAGLYFAYLWPQVEPLDPESPGLAAAVDAPAAASAPPTQAAASPDPASDAGAEAGSPS